MRNGSGVWLVLSVATALWASTAVASDGLAMLPMFGTHSRCINSAGTCGWQFAQYADNYSNPDWVYHPGWDFNLTNEADPYGYIYAMADGVAIVRNVDAQDNPATYGELLIRHDVGGQTFWSAYYHVSKVYVRNGWPVKKGNRIAKIGSVGANGAVHLHWEIRVATHEDEEDPDYWGYSLQNRSNVLAWYRDPEPFVAGLNVDHEAWTQGGAIGLKSGSLQWWYGMTGTDLYNTADMTAKRCYRQNYSGGSFGDCAIVFDALGGSRAAYTVRTGFWSSTEGNGWSQLVPAGPQSSLGMPITDEYNQGGSTARQDFQKGYLYYTGSAVELHPYPTCAPGWTASGWNNSFSYLFARAYERNGSRNDVGYPDGSSHSGLVYDYGSYKRQDFIGGTYGNCCIMYDPNNAVGNSQATNEAYYVWGKFLQKWEEKWAQGVYSAPTRDWYMGPDPATGTGSYPIQNFMRSGGEQHYIIIRNGDITTGTPEWHSSYRGTLASKTPSTPFDVRRGGRYDFELRVTNTGTVNWRNDPVNAPVDFVSLKSCDVNGTVVPSFFNSDNDPTLGWIDQLTPCTMVEGSVAPGQVATFRFAGQIGSNAPLGSATVYFRVNHSLAGLMDNRSGLSFTVNVVQPPAPQLVNGPGQMVYRDHLAFASNNGNIVWFTTHYPVAGGDYSNTAPTVKVYRNGSRIVGYKEGSYLYITEGYDPESVYEADYPRLETAVAYGYTYNDWVTTTAPSEVLGGTWGNTHAGVQMYRDGVHLTCYKEVGTNLLVTPAPYVSGANYVAAFPMLASSAHLSYVSYGPGEMVYQERLTFSEQSGNTVWFTAAWPVAGGDYAATSPYLKVYRNGHLIVGYKELDRVYITEGYDATALYTIDYPRKPERIQYAYTYNGVPTFTTQAPVWGGVWNKTHAGLRVYKNGVQITAYKEVGSNLIVTPGTAYDVNATYEADYVEGAPPGGGGYAKQLVHQEPSQAPLVLSLVLGQNPARGLTKLSFTLPQAGQASIDVFDVQGRRVATLVQTRLSAGPHTTSWSSPGRLAGGVYFVRLVTSTGTLTKKLVLLH